MLSIVTGTFRLFAQRWPALIAIFLAGWAVNFLLIRFAGFVGNIDPLFGLLVLPLAVLARLASYVAMFLVLRDAMPTFTTISQEKVHTDAAPPLKFHQILGSSILAFFLVFATWNMMRDDLIAYAASQLEQYNPFDENATYTTAFEIGPSVMTVTVVIVAFILRLAIKKFADRLPVWTSYLSVYLEAVWVFVAVFVIQSLLSGIPAWVQSRVIVVWVNETIESAKAIFAPLRWLVDIWTWITEQAGLLIVLPLAWLALAGIVYSAALAISAKKVEETTGVVAAVQVRYRRVPRFVRKRVSSLTDGFVGRWRPIADSARLIWGAGVAAIALFVLAYAVLDTSTLWILQGIYRLLGPHELGWWFAVDNQISLVADAIVEPLRLCLIAAAYDFGLKVSRERDAQRRRADVELEAERQ